MKIHSAIAHSRLIALPALLFAASSAVAQEEAPLAPPVLTKAPELIEAVEAPYPPSLLSERLTGEVLLYVDIGTDGLVADVVVSSSSGELAFDLAAVEALRQYRFSPAELDGVPAGVRVEYRMAFEPPPLAESAPAPVTNLRGFVLERGTREPLAGALVAVVEQELAVTADEAGGFELRGVSPGMVVVRISALGHRTFETTVEVVPEELTELTAYLWPTLGDDFEAVVRGERLKKDVTRRVLARQELTTVPGTFGDPLRVVQNLPGMARPAFGFGDLLVRGAAPEDTAVLVDGVPIPLLYHFAGGPSVINPAFVERIDFLPGAYGSRYGRAIAGVIDVETRKEKGARYHGNFDIDLLDAGFYLSGPISEGRPWGTWALAARRSYVDAFLPFVLDAVREPGQAAFATSPRYWDYQGRYDLTLGRDELEFLAFGSSDTLNFTQAGDLEATGFTAGTEQAFHRFRIKWSRAFENGWKLGVAPTVGLTDVVFNFNDQIRGDIFSVDFNTRISAARQLSERLSFETGLDLNANLYDLGFSLPVLPEYQTYPGENAATEITRRTFDVDTFSQALYAELVWEPFSGLRLVPGVRAELYSLRGGRSLSLEPRLAARYEVAPDWTLKAAWGLFRQPPRPMDVDTDFGNPYLGLAASAQQVLGFEGRLLPFLTLDVQGFYNRRTELVVASNAVVERDGRARTEVLRNGGEGEVWGVEVLLRHELTKRFFGWVAYTLSSSEQRDEETGAWLPVASDQRHILTLVGSLKLDGGWELGTRFRLTSGRPETPVSGGIFDADTGGFVRLNGVPGSTRGATFHQLDVRFEKTFLKERYRWSVYLDVQNVYNATNPEFLLYDYRFRTSAGFPGLPILPTLGVSGAF